MFLFIHLSWLFFGSLVLYFFPKKIKKKKKMEEWPPVTILIPCFNEENSIELTATALQFLDYPKYEVIFVDDASTDKTPEKIEEFVKNNENFYLLRLQENQGKANALNIALRFVSTPYVVVIDADTILHPSALKALISHFTNEKIGAVTANPIVFNRKSFLGKLQTIEFTSIIGLIKMSQRIFGRIFSVSGCAAAYRTDVLIDVGGFSPYSATEDIDVTWKIQRLKMEVVFEPDAIVFIHAPENFKDYWNQRKRWALGGWHLLRTHRTIFKNFKESFLWPLYIDVILSYVWSFDFVLLIIYVVLSKILNLGINISLIAWGGSFLTALGIIQATVASILYRKYDPKIPQYLIYAPWYFIFFFTINAFAVVRTSYKGLISPLHVVKWRSPERKINS
ncbi:glycosyl transferase family 2 [Methanothermus fervidus DSM 2088]|uniref:Glycosyl transferase family 2 n=1 Tax=Methanothermus fervidus (strain ATCC 43054 / DSM 2088 / JCM 10308 / V24 S) TaxID=523846 RepID=E3GVY8_METFV|nr:glycosyl transferase family 2 [Methanothermus fervidus DSM 2088]